MADFPIIPGEPFSAEQNAMLDAPLDAQLLRERDGAGGKKLLYIDGRTAIETANRIFGKGKWGFRITSRSHEKLTQDNGTVKEYFTADIELYVSGNPFPFPGDGIGGVKSNTLEGIEMARKDAVTDALKRALCYYGSQFGLDLRDKDGEGVVEIADGVQVKVKEVQVNKSGANTLKPSAAARVNSAPVRQQIADKSRIVESKPPQRSLTTQQATREQPAKPLTSDQQSRLMALDAIKQKCIQIQGAERGAKAYIALCAHVTESLNLQLVPDYEWPDDAFTMMHRSINRSTVGAGSSGK